MSRRGPLAAAGLAIIVVLGVGILVGVWLTIPPAPTNLQAAQQVSVAPVTQRDYDDSRSVSVTVSAPKQQQLSAPLDGRITMEKCAAGQNISSGESVVAINGTGILALATAVPPWRDLTLGDQGSDVAALNAELIRLGFSAPTGDVVTRATVSAYTQLAQKAGVGVAPGGVISFEQILWLPGAQVTVAQCSAQLGDVVTAGGALFTLDTVPSIQVEIPSGAVAGSRVLTLDDGQVPVGDNGQVTGADASSTVLNSQAYTSASANPDGSRQFQASWVLVHPIPVMVVPPGAVGGMNSDPSCVFGVNNTVYPVHVVGSELGQTFVVADSSGGGSSQAKVKLPAQVRANVDENASCK